MYIIVTEDNPDNLDNPDNPDKPMSSSPNNLIYIYIYVYWTATGVKPIWAKLYMTIMVTLIALVTLITLEIYL